MPHKDGERRREYGRQYMRELRAAVKEGRPYKRHNPPRPTVKDELKALAARVAQLEADLAATREAAS
jgi:HAMP domain-containing protein